MKLNLKPVQILLLLVIILITIFTYWKIQDNKFIILDDPVYIFENQQVVNGLSLENIKWAFSSFYACNWHPLTWLSHMLDCEIYGINPKGHHLNNLLFHLINTLLIFLILQRMTGAYWQSFFVASLFALHPINVESIAWASERKNVLSTFFWMSTIYAYIRYTEKNTISRYLLVASLFILGLMSKAMLITLPFVLLLLDIWPLDRINNYNLANLDSLPLINLINPDKKTLRGIFLVIEKIPLILCSAASSVLTIMAQHEWSAVRSFESFPLNIRIANAIISYKNYIIKILWPRDLAFLYPHPENSISYSEIIWSAILLITITFLVLYYSMRYKYLFVGWFWYLGTLIPVIGIVQVGYQQIADRYVYIPIIGFLIMIAWGIPLFFRQFYHRSRLFGVSWIIILLLFVIQTYRQVQFWRDSETLFVHTLEKTSNNYLTHFYLGTISAGQFDLEGAAYQFNAALKIKPDFADAYYNLGNIYMIKGMIKKSIFYYSETLRINPKDASAHNNIGIAFASENNLDKAITHFFKALSIYPDYEEARINLSLALQNKK